jgi:hypothetical protein
MIVVIPVSGRLPKISVAEQLAERVAALHG